MVPKQGRDYSKRRRSLPLLLFLHDQVFLAKRAGRAKLAAYTVLH